VEETAYSKALLAARDQIKFIRESRERGEITNIDPPVIQELMSYLTHLAKLNQTADTLENICAAAITYYEMRLLQDYYEHVKKIIAVGEGL